MVFIVKQANICNQNPKKTAYYVLHFINFDVTLSMKTKRLYIVGLLMPLLLGTTSLFSQTTLFFENCNTLGTWTNTGRIFPANTPGYNFLAVVPTIPAADHTGGGGGVFYTNGNAVYTQAGAGNYIIYRIESPNINLTGFDNCRLEFWMQMRSETGNWDGGFVEWSNNGGTTWTKFTAAQLCIPFDGNMSQNGSSTPFYFMTTPCWFNPRTTWTRVVANISAFDNVPNFKVRYTFHSDEAVADLGWALDDIRIVSIAQPQVQGNAIVIPDNDVTPIAADFTDFGNVGVGFSLTRTFYIHNIGESPLTLTGTPMVTTTGTGFSVVAQPSTNIVPPGGSVSFDVQFAPGVTGLVNGTVNIPNSDNYSSCSPPNPYNYSIRANAIIINTPPFIIDPPVDTSVCPNTLPLNIPFNVGDNQQPAGSLVLSATSSNPAVITNANIVFGGAGASRNVTLTPNPGAVGSSTITITINDLQPTNNDSTFSFVLTLEDNVAPVALCQDVLVQLDATGNASITPAQANNGSTDDCGIQSITLSQSNFTCTDVGTQLVDLIVTDIVGNSSICQFNVNVAPAPMVNNFTLSDYNGYNVSCFGLNDGSIQINTSSGCAPYTYVWSHDPSNTSNSANGLIAGGYTVTVTDAAGQQQIIPIILGQPDALTDLSTATDISCFGEVDGSVLLNATGGVNPYQYSQGPSLSNMPAGTYNYTITDNNNCVLPVSLTINEPAAINISGQNEYFLYCGEDITLNIDVSGGSGGYTYNWSSPFFMDCAICEDPIASPDKSTVFTVQVIDSRGCYEFYNITTEVDCNVFVPNAFTPNVDEINPVFKVHVANVRGFEMKIFDRWGEEIFYSTDKDDGWDGTLYSGLRAPIGVYVYDIYLIMPNGKEVNMRGMVNLLR